MTSAEDQAASERAIFAEFAQVAGLRIRPGSIESRAAPEPDLRCEVEGEGPRAFELGEVISEALETATSERVALRRRFRAAYSALPPDDRARIEACLGGLPEVFVGFRSGTPPGRWRHAVQPILDTLVARARATELREGEIPVWQIPPLQALLTDMTVRPTSGSAPFLGVLAVTEVVDSTRRLLDKKFARRYRSDVPVDLLAYYVGAPPPDAHSWRADVLAFIRARWQRSPFRRVWLFDGFARAIVLVHPNAPRS